MTKVHPLGFRLNHKIWNTIWYNKYKDNYNNYSNLLHQNLKINKYIEGVLKKYGYICKTPLIRRKLGNIYITIPFYFNKKLLFSYTPKRINKLKFLTKINDSKNFQRNKIREKIIKKFRSLPILKIKNSLELLTNTKIFLKFFYIRKRRESMFIHASILAKILAKKYRFEARKFKRFIFILTRNFKRLIKKKIIFQVFVY